MTELKLNKHLGGERPRDSPGGRAAPPVPSRAPPVPSRCPDGTGLSAAGSEGHPNTRSTKKKWPSRGQTGTPKKVQAVFPVENILKKSFRAKARPSIHSQRPSGKQTPAQLSSRNTPKLRVSDQPTPREGQALPGGSCGTPRPRCTLHQRRRCGF